VNISKRITRIEGLYGHRGISLFESIYFWRPATDMIEACIFDLDGVIVDTAKYHFKAWSQLARSLDITFTEVDNEPMKGLSRKDSLDILLSHGEQAYTQEEKQEFLLIKNNTYLKLVKDMDESEVLPGVEELLALLKENNIKIALGSASKNARPILDKIGLTNRFDVIVDGNDVKRAKPDPEVFLKGASLLGCLPSSTIVWEDSAKGIDAALSGGFRSVGIGHVKYLNHAHIVIPSLRDIDMNFITDIL